MSINLTATLHYLLSKARELSKTKSSDNKDVKGMFKDISTRIFFFKPETDSSFVTVLFWRGNFCQFPRKMMDVRIPKPDTCVLSFP